MNRLIKSPIVLTLTLLCVTSCDPYFSSSRIYNKTIHDMVLVIKFDSTFANHSNRNKTDYITQLFDSLRILEADTIKLVGRYLLKSNSSIPFGESLSSRPEFDWISFLAIISYKDTLLFQSPDELREAFKHNSGPIFELTIQ